MISRHHRGNTNPVFQNLAAIVTDRFENLLDLLDEARVVDRFCQLNVTKVTWALVHALLAGCTLELAIDGAKTRIVETIDSRLLTRLVHGFRIHDMSHTHILDFLWREETELDLLHRLEGRIRVRKGEVRHVGGLEWNRLSIAAQKTRWTSGKGGADSSKWPDNGFLGVFSEGARGTRTKSDGTYHS
jgi:hypothetical protein